MISIVPFGTNILSGGICPTFENVGYYRNSLTGISSKSNDCKTNENGVIEKGMT